MTKNNKISALSQTVATAQIAAKIYQGQPPTFGLHYSRFHSTRFTFDGDIAERVKAVLLLHTVFPSFASNTFEANKNGTRHDERRLTPSDSRVIIARCCAQ